MDISSINSMLTNSDIAKTKSTIEMQDQKLKSFEYVLNDATKAKKVEELKKACVEFESYFIHNMYKEMRKTVPNSQGIFPKGQAELIFEDMLDEESAKNSAKAGGIGLAEMMYRQMSKNL